MRTTRRSTNCLQSSSSWTSPRQRVSRHLGNARTEQPTSPASQPARQLAVNPVQPRNPGRSTGDQKAMMELGLRLQPVESSLAFGPRSLRTFELLKGGISGAVLHTAPANRHLQRHLALTPTGGPRHRLGTSHDLNSIFELKSFVIALASFLRAAAIDSQRNLPISCLYVMRTTLLLQRAPCRGKSKMLVEKQVAPPPGKLV